MRDKKSLILNNVSLLGSVLVLFNANPLIKSILRKIISKFSKVLSQKKNTINYISLSTVIFSSFYFLYPDDYGMLMDQILFVLLFQNTKLQWKELKSYIGISNLNSKWVKFAKSFCVSLILSWKVKYFTNKVVLAKFLPKSLKSIKRYQITLLLLFPVSKISTSVFGDKGDICEFIVSLFVSIGLMQRTQNSHFLREIMIMLNSIYYYKYLMIPKSLYNYSFKTLLQTIYTSLIPDKLKANKKSYKKFQCLIISIILINLIKYNSDDKSYFNKFQHWILDSINNGALIRTADTMKHADNHLSKNKDNKNETIYVKRRRTSSINRINPKDLKVYENDYDLRLSK